MYQHLHSKGVQGIPTALGLFVDPEDGPSALVLTHGGQSIFHRSADIEYFQREAFQTTLKAIHAAGVLHGDIRSPNLLIDEFGESSIIDFDQAEKNDSEDAQESEFRRLSSILEGRGR
jgi:serine/threonine protein kinase